MRLGEVRRCGVVLDYMCMYVIHGTSGVTSSINNLVLVYSPV